MSNPTVSYFFALLILSALVKHVSLHTAAKEGIFNSFKSIFVLIKFKKSHVKRESGIAGTDQNRPLTS